MKTLYLFIILLNLLSRGFCEETWINFIGNQSCHPNLYYEPNTFEELSHYIKSAASKNYKIRAIGNGYSISDIGCTNGCLLSLKHLKSILSIDKEKKLVCVEAGISLEELNQQLEIHGLALPNQAAISEISLGGALSTGVHGTGHTGSLSSFIREIELITADGNLHKLSAESDPNVFPAVSLSLGSLGVIYAVTVQCESLFYVIPSIEICDLKDILENYKTIYSSNDYFQFFWNVETDAVTLNCWNRCKQPIERNSSTIQPIFSHQALSWYKIDVNDKDLFSEIAIPLDFLSDAMQQLKRLILKYKQLGATFTEINVRFVEPDKQAYLSPSSDRTVAYLALCLLDGDKDLTFYKEFEELMFSFQGRPHWGKINFLDYQKADALYGANFQKFIDIKLKLDPNEVFSNSFTDRLFTKP